MNYTTAQVKKELKSTKGFTLIELLVTIAILAVLAVIGAAVYGNVTQGARDARRDGDIEAIASAIENTYNSANVNPYDAAPTSFQSGTVPVDPLAANSYCFWSGTTAPTSAPANPAGLTGTNCASTTVNSVNGTPVTSTFNFPAAVWWKVCAAKEVGGIICRGSQR